MMDTETASQIRSMLVRIAAGEADPYRGAAAIWTLLSSAAQPADYPEALLPFVGYASEIQDHPDDRERYERLIVETASELQAQGYRF